MPLVRDCYFTQKCVMTMRLITVKPSHIFGSRIVYISVRLYYNLLEDRKSLKGNTVGSRLSVEKAYIAGFLDGDGSIMLQLKKRLDTSRGYRFMATICFYQDSRHEKPLFWMQEVLGLGYVSRRNDAISELRINGFAQIQSILTELKPYVRFKKVQIEAMIHACSILKENINLLTDKQLMELVELILVIQNENYKAHRKKTRDEFIEMLSLTP